MRSDVQRGRLIFITRQAHARLIPDEKQDKLGKRMWLVVQADILNESSGDTIIVPLRTAPPGVTKSKGVDAFLPRGKDLASQNSFADCSHLHTIREKDVFHVLAGTYLRDIMKDVDDALRLAMDLDSDNIYKEKSF